MTHTETNDGLDAIAIIGLSCRVPGARDAAEFWSNLRAGVESITFLDADDLRAEGLDPAILETPGYVNASSVLEDADKFDAPFFGFSAREAEVLDPQQRVFLECAWSALEDAGYIASTSDQLIGVYGGADMSRYLFNLFANRDLVQSMGSFQISLGNDKDHLTTRVAYKLDLKGPAVTVQTTCSTSLVAVCQACQSLLDYHCDIALAGGSSLSLPQRAGYAYQEGGISSPDGHCRTFDARANGTISGSGVGVVALKRLADAIADGDHVRAVVRGFALNNDGSSKVGYTAPSVDGQAEVVAMAQAMAQVDPETINYVEAHGTATPLGDPIEIAALTQVFGARTDRRQFCAIGSVKSNFGHLNSAAGVAGLIKTVLALQHAEIPPSLHYERPNPNIAFESSPFFVNDRLRAWPTNGAPRRAGVSSFGIGGTNAHVVVEEAPAQATATSPRPHQIIVISTRAAESLDEATQRLARSLDADDALDLADVAYTLQVGRRVFDHRRAVVCSADTAATTLRDAGPATTVHGAAAPPVVFLFPGQGAQRAGMGRALHRVEPVFRREVDRCCELLRPHLDLDLREIMFDDQASARLRRTELAQPALFVVEYALAELFRSWGVEPAAMVGHSIGEYVAACLAGVFGLEDALRIVATRGRLMGAMPEGAMLAILEPEATVAEMIGPTVDIAVVNGPSVTVVSGSIADIEQLQERLQARGVVARRLETSHAFHSRTMDDAVAPLVECVASAKLDAPRIPILSNTTGTWLTSALATDPAYWGRHLRGAVRFDANLAELFLAPDHLLLEVGPGAVLGGLITRHPGRDATQIVVPSLDGDDETRSVMDAVARLWLAGVEIDWRAHHAEEQRSRVSLPTYPFQRHRYWIDAAPPPPAAHSAMNAPPPGLPALRKSADVGDWLSEPVWKPTPLTSHLDPREAHWIVLADDDGLGDAVIERLEALGAVATCVRRSDATRRDERDVVIDPADPAAYACLTDDVVAAGDLPTRVLHLWSVDRQDTTRGTREVLARTRRDGLESLLHLARALGRSGGPIEIAIVANGLHALSHAEEALPGKAILMGPARVIPQEKPGLACRTIDVALGDDDATQHTAAQLIDEMCGPGNGADVAYRGTERWARDFAPLELDAHAIEGSVVRQGGVYLITGGCGQIGLLMAAFLAQVAHARLVLIGRTPAPPREVWAQLASERPYEADGQLAAHLLHIEQLGGEVRTACANAADRAGMQRVIDETIEAFGEINGVIHGAGYTTAGALVPIEDTDAAHIEAHFRPKVEGVMLIEELLRDRPLDFVLLHASLSAVLGGLGFAAYASANAFMDGFARRVNRAGDVPWISVDWDGWHFPTAEEIQSYGATVPSESILPAEGIELFRRILSHAPRRVIVSTRSLGTRVDEWVGLEETRAATTTSSSSLTMHERPELPTPFAAPEGTTQNAIAEIWSRLLGVSPIGAHDNFFELGGHSLLAIQVISRLRDEFGVETGVNAIFEAPTIAELAARVEATERADEGTTSPPKLQPIGRDRYRTTLGEDGAFELPPAFDDAT